MHKADVVGVALADEAASSSCSHSGAMPDGCPLVGGALGVAAQPLHRAVDADSALAVIAYGAEPGFQPLDIGFFPVYEQLCLDGVQVGSSILQKRSGRVSAPACSTLTCTESGGGGCGQGFVLHGAVMSGYGFVGNISVRRGDAQRWDSAPCGRHGGGCAVKNGGNAAVRAAQRDAQLGGNRGSPSLRTSASAAMSAVALHKSKFLP